MEKENESLPEQTGGEHYQQLEDRVMKTAAQFFGEDLLSFAGLEGTIVGIAPTEQIHLEIKQMEEDFNFILADGTWLHLEFESDSITEQDLRRFREYDANMSLIHNVAVSTAVLCSSDVKVLKRELRNGKNIYRVELIRMKDRNADAVFEGLQKKIRHLKPLKRSDVFPLLLTPLMSGEMELCARICGAVEILQSDYIEVKRDELKKMEAVLYALAIKFLKKEELKLVKERMRMTILGQMLREDGIEEGLKEGLKKGLERGEYIKLISLVTKKMQKGQRPDEIAEDLLEAPDVIQPIYEFMEANPGCDITSVYEHLTGRPMR